MSLDKDTFVDYMEIMVDAFPNWTGDISDRRFMATWYSFFEDMSDEDFATMVKDYINKETYPPSIAGLKRYTPIKEEPFITDADRALYDEIDKEREFYAKQRKSKD